MFLYVITSGQKVQCVPLLYNIKTGSTQQAETADQGVIIILQRSFYAQNRRHKRGRPGDGRRLAQRIGKRSLSCPVWQKEEDMKYIGSFREGERVSDVYLCKHRHHALAKNGKAYENVTFQDKTGIVDAKIWDPNSSGIGEFGAMDYVFVTGDVVLFQGSPQLNIKRARRAEEGEYVPADYVPCTNKDADQMYMELRALLDTVGNQYLRLLIAKYFDDETFVKAFKKHSAAKTVHHGFVGGLLEHTLSVVKMCDYFTQCYPYLKRDLLLTAAAFHDVGKLKEISAFPENDYTDDGQLLGHIVMGCELVGYGCRSIKGFPKKMASELQHCILAHHGELEYGSPKKPALPEALALNLADNADARLESMRELIEGSGENTGWLGYNKLFESNIRKSSEY